MRCFPKSKVSLFFFSVSKGHRRSRDTLDWRIGASLEWKTTRKGDEVGVVGTDVTFISSGKTESRKRDRQR